MVSIGFELMEYTLECQLPNFGECWWDHVSDLTIFHNISAFVLQWILDFLVCNGLGIYLGMLTCHYLSMKVSNMLLHLHMYASFVGLP